MALASSISLLLTSQNDVDDSTKENNDNYNDNRNETITFRYDVEPSPKYNANQLEYKSLTVNNLIKTFDLIYVRATVYQNLTFNAGLDTTNLSVTNEINIQAG